MNRRALGAAVATSLILAAGVFAAERSVSRAATPDELVTTWIDALGGLEMYWPLKTARYTITTEIYDTETGRLRRTRPRYVTIAKTDRGDLARIERWEGNDFIAHGWDGETVWARYNGEALAPGDKDFDEVLYVAGDVHYWIGLPFKLSDPGVNLHDRGVDDQGRQVVGVSFGDGVGLHDGDSWQYWFVEGRTWPVQVAYKEENRTNWNYLRFEDVRTVDGYTFVGRRVHYNDEGALTKVLYTHDFELNPELDMGVFSPPQ